MNNVPTTHFYGQLQYVFDYFNRELFAGQLPQMILTVQRDRGTMGYFSASRWSHDGKSDFHELALNPTYFADHKLIEIFQTIVHEQVHAWQHHFGEPSRKTYHNREWAEKMISIGLMPSSTGARGGKTTGQKMADYPIEGGKFKAACVALFMSGFDFKWVDRRTSSKLANADMDSSIDTGMAPPAMPAALAELAPGSVEYVEMLLDTTVMELMPTVSYVTDVKEQAIAAAKEKIAYKCVNAPCGIQVWGKPGLVLQCHNVATKCAHPMLPKDKESLP